MESKYFESLYPVEARDQELGKIVGYIREGVSSSGSRIARSRAEYHTRAFGIQS